MDLDSDRRLDVGFATRGQIERRLAKLDAKEAKRRQRLRSLAIAWALAAIALMFFLVTIVRLGANVANRPF
jgi:hypothetical protein